jgi:hypothetical protein
MKNLQRFAVGLLVAIGAASVAVYATPLTKFYDVTGYGLKLANGGVGLVNLGAGTANLSVTVNGPVVKAFLYWAGREVPCDPCTVPPSPPPYKDQQLRFDGNLVTGTVTGEEFTPEFTPPFLNVGYRADVTAIVQAKGWGNLTFQISDADLNNNLWRLDGAGLLVVYKDYKDLLSWLFPSRIIIHDGLDFAFDLGNATFPPPKTPGMVTVPTTFDHGALKYQRPAELTIFGGDGNGGGSSITISNNPTLFHTFDATDGPTWDTDKDNIVIPANVGTTTVQVFSGPGKFGEGQFPDSLLWQVAALRVPFAIKEKETGCSPGFWKNHTSAWTKTGYSTTKKLNQVFTVPVALASLGNYTLLQGLQFAGGPGTLGGARILLRAAVAALLNSAHPDQNYPRTTSEVIGSVNAALASNDRDTMLALATALDNDNNLGCTLGCKITSHWKNGKHYGDD